MLRALKTWFLGEFGNLFSRGKSRQRTSGVPSRKNVSRLAVEELEPRLVPSSSPIYGLTGSAFQASTRTYVNPAGGILTSTSAGVTDELTGVEAFAIRADGNVYVEFTNNDLVMDTPQLGQFANFGTVKAFAMRNDGCAYIEQATTNFLYLNAPSANYTMGTVQGFGLRNDGNGYVWNVDGDLFLNTPSQNFDFGTVQGFVMTGGHDGCFLQGGNVYVNTQTDASSWIGYYQTKVWIGSSVTSLGIAGNGDVIMRNSAGDVYDYVYNSAGGTSTSIGSSVTSFAIAGNGDVIMLNSAGDVYDWCVGVSAVSPLVHLQFAVLAPHSTQIGSSVTSFGIAGNGDVIMLNSAGDLYDQYNVRVGGDSTLIANNVESFSINSSGIVVATLDSATLPGDTAGESYRSAITPAGSGTFTYRLVSGTLPAGLSLGTTGIFSGTPTVAGTYSFTVKATNATGTVIATEVCSLTVAPGQATRVSLSMPSSAVAGVHFLITVHAYDAYGNGVTEMIKVLVINGGSAGVPVSGGTGTVYFTLNNPGVSTIQAKSAYGATSTQSITITPAPQQSQTYYYTWDIEIYYGDNTDPTTAFTYTPPTTNYNQAVADVNAYTLGLSQQYGADYDIYTAYVGEASA